MWRRIFLETRGFTWISNFLHWLPIPAHRTHICSKAGVNLKWLLLAQTSRKKICLQILPGNPAYCPFKIWTNFHQALFIMTPRVPLNCSVMIKASGSLGPHSHHAVAEQVENSSEFSPLVGFICCAPHPQLAGQVLWCRPCTLPASVSSTKITSTFFPLLLLCVLCTCLCAYARDEASWHESPWQHSQVSQNPSELKGTRRDE